MKNLKLQNYIASPLNHTLILFLLFSIAFVSNLTSQEYGQYLDPRNQNRTSRMNIDSAVIEVRPKGIYAEVTTEFWFRPLDLVSPSDTLEYYCDYALPKTDFMNDSWLWVEDTLVQAMVLDKNEASLIYENIVKRTRRDPSIIYRLNTNGNYQIRVFPCPGNKSRHAKISYWTKMSFINSYAVVNFYPTVLNTSASKTFPRTIRIHLTDRFTNVDLASATNMNLIEKGQDKYYEFTSNQFANLNYKFQYSYDFSTPYFSKSKRIDGQEYYFSMYDSKILSANYQKQKINFLIDYDPNRTSISKQNVVLQLKNALKSNFSEQDSFNLMFGNKSTINLTNRWVPCHIDSINAILDTLVYKNLSTYSNLSDLMIDGIKFNNSHETKSSIVLITSSEHAPTLASANPLIQECLKTMGAKDYKISTIDFSDIQFAIYFFGGRSYNGGQYFNEKIAEMTRGESFTNKINKYSVETMLNNYFSSLKGSLSEVGMNIEPTDGIAISKTTESIIDESANKKLVFEYGKFEGTTPVNIKIAGILDGEVVIKNYSLDSSKVKISNESAKTWNWKYLRALEDKSNKSKKESYDMTWRSITNRILTTQTAFLCLEPWMMPNNNVVEEDGDGRGGGKDDNTNTSVADELGNIGIEINFGPNPATSFVNFSLDVNNSITQIYSLEVCDIFGSVIKEFSFDLNANSINLNWNLENSIGEKLPSGTYFFVIKTNLGKKVVQLIVI